MIWNLLSGADNPYRKFENVGEAALYALLGFIVVFVGIAFLILVVWLVGKFMVKTSGQPKVKPQPKEKEPPKETIQTPVACDEITEETVAVITAAIMAYYQQNNPKCEFTVKRIKRI